jgi:hypothetical protein
VACSFLGGRSIFLNVLLTFGVSDFVETKKLLHYWWENMECCDWRIWLNSITTKNANFRSLKYFVFSLSYVANRFLNVCVVRCFLCV